MENRAKVIDDSFRRRVIEGQLPPTSSAPDLHRAGLTRAELMELFESQLISRHIDLEARRLRAKNEAFYTIGSAGHEGNAAFGKAFRYTDPAFLHYRSGALFIQRSRQVFGSTPIFDLLLSVVASADDPISQGRHKVFGSVDLNVPPQTSTIASHLPKAVGTALSISRARQLKLESHFPNDAITICSFGDASSNHSTAMGAFNTAEWIAYQQIPMPLLFVCEDNGIGISVPTPEGWIEQRMSRRPIFRYFQCDGLNLIQTYQTAVEAQKFVRASRRPAFLHMKTVRLLGHAGSDVETTYHNLKEIEANEARDPLLYSARIVLEEGLLTGKEIVDLYHSLGEQVRSAALEVTKRPKLRGTNHVMESLVPKKRTPKKIEYKRTITENERNALFERDYIQMNQLQHFAKLFNWGLADLMLEQPNTVLFGEDVAKKGGVYHITTGLQKKFGRKRVYDSVLDEQSILGVAMGMAHNTLLPIVEIQFLAYLHNAEDQLRGEAATLSFFSSGQYTNPMIVRIPGLAYQKGFGGHFHNDNSLAVLRDIPGIIVACPSHGEDAVLMLRTCAKKAQEEGRVVAFIEPIALYMTKDLHKKDDRLWCKRYPKPSDSKEVKLGEFAVYDVSQNSTSDLCIVTYGNGTYLSLQAQKALFQRYQIKTRVIDLRWLSEIRYEALLKEINNCSSTLIVEECRKTGSLSEELLTRLYESGYSGKLERITAEDSFIPLGNAANFVLPSKNLIIERAQKLAPQIKGGARA